MTPQATPQVAPKPKERRVSASALKTISECTMKYYLSRVLLLPEKTWPRTSAGSAAHAIFEALYRDYYRPKSRGYYAAIKAAQTIYACPTIKRLLRSWIHKTKMPINVSDDIDAMILLVINETDFLDLGATRRFDPEYAFEFKLRNGGTVKGFIDRLAQYHEQFIIHDYKSQRDRFDDEEVRDSFQSLVYQLFVFKTFGALSEVRYYLVRHPPTKKMPHKHVQITMPASPTQLAGFELYLEHMHDLMNRFTAKDATTGYHADEGFCERVCTYRRPFSYLSVRKRATGKLVGNYLLDTAPHLADDEIAETLAFRGCPRFNPQ